MKEGLRPSRADEVGLFPFREENVEIFDAFEFIVVSAREHDF
jgi:hypothetical protein